MWSLIMSKTGAVLAISAVVLILVGVLFFKNTLLKSQLAECSANVKELTNDLQKAQLAVDETKKSLELRESEIKVTQAQILAGNKAVQEYKARMDKTNELLSNAKCVSADEKMGVIDVESNNKIIDYLNCLSYGSCERMHTETKN